MDRNRTAALTAEIRIMIMLLSKTLMRMTQDNLREKGVSINMLQVGMLRAISGHNFTISELGKLFVFDPSTLVPLVDDLERKGLVARTKDPNDRRRTPLVATAAGLALLREADVAHETPEMLAGVEAMGAERAQMLSELLAELTRSFPEAHEALCAAHEHLKTSLSGQGTTSTAVTS
jgi:DNA-binding MarR family transcriptional regulator